MELKKMLPWGAVGVLAVIPLNWLRVWFAGDLPAGSPISELLVATVVMWSVGGALAYYLLWASKKAKARKAMQDEKLLAFLGAPLQSITPSKAILKPGETAHYSIMGELQEIKTVGFSANSAGVSVRVAKGVTLRTGSTRGKAQKGMVTVSAGELVVTDQRILFAGDRKSFALQNSKVLNTTNYADGFSFTDGKSTYTVITGNGEAHLEFAATLQKIFRS